MEQYIVTGMSCAACQARVEKAVSKVPGVTTCSVSLLTHSMGVEGSAKASEIIAAVENAGYGASLKENNNLNNKGSLSAKLAAEEEALEDKETPVLKKRLWVSVVFLLILMYFSMGHMMFGFPLPKWFEGNHVAMGLIQLLLSAIIMVINQKFFISGFKSLFHGAPNMDTLIALGSGASFVYSTVMLFVMSDVVIHKGSDAAMKYMDEFYFESAAMILTLITVGKMLESYSKGKTTSALKSLLKIAPKTATVIRDEKEVSIPVDSVVVGDVCIVKPGETIPVDGIVIEGTSAVNEAALTGESMPVDKEVGADVMSASINTSGFIKIRATKVGEDTSLAQIIQMVSDASATKAPVAKLADKISGVFVPCVIALSVIVTFIWLLCGSTIGFALSRGICVLVVSCPCALGLATPVAIMVGNGVGARNGILFKTAAALQMTGKTEIVALDKTGTITTGEPVVTDIFVPANINEKDLLSFCFSVEQKSEHPISKAIVKYANENNIKELETKDFETFAGSGLKGIVDGKEVEIGSFKYITGKFNKYPNAENFNAKDVKEKAQSLASEGKTPILIAIDEVISGIIAVSDKIKDDSREAIRSLKELGIKVVMLTGDNEKTAKAIGDMVGTDEIISGVLPDGKDKVIKDLMKNGKVAMIGDGINDAPALTSADTGIAIGAGTDVAIDAADVVLMKSSLMDAVSAIRLSKKTYKNIVENLFWALFYNVLLIPVAAGAYSKLFGITMNPMLGALAMSLSSFCVVSNALRLNTFKVKSNSSANTVSKNIDEQNLNKDSNDLKEKEKLDSDKMNKKTIKIKGMMCEHCEATVKKSLEEIEGVTVTEISHKKGFATIAEEKEIDETLLKEAVESKGYDFISVE